MSAYLCSEDHIALIVNAHPNPEQRNGQSFHLLVNENMRSLRERYPGRDFLEEWEGAARHYKFEESSPKFIVAKCYAEAREEEWKVRGYPAVAKAITPARLEAQIRKACDCFDYQACETENYYETEAAKFVEQVRAQFPERKKQESEALWGLS